VNPLPAILLAEDDPNDVLLIRRALTKAHIANPVVTVEDGDAVIDYLDGRGVYGDRTPHPAPILLLLDLKMPRKSGFEVLEWLRARPFIGRLPVVVLTSSREMMDINHAYDLGANSYLVKPGSPDELLAIVRTLGMYWLVFNEPPETVG
jgi:CheY-like chemotaxis protein